MQCSNRELRLVSLACGFARPRAVIQGSLRCAIALVLTRIIPAAFSGVLGVSVIFASAFASNLAGALETNLTRSRNGSAIDGIPIDSVALSVALAVALAGALVSALSFHIAAAIARAGAGFRAGLLRVSVAIATAFASVFLRLLSIAISSSGPGKTIAFAFICFLVCCPSAIIVAALARADSGPLVNRLAFVLGLASSIAIALALALSIALTYVLASAFEGFKIDDFCNMFMDSYESDLIYSFIFPFSTFLAIVVLLASLFAAVCSGICAGALKERLSHVGRYVLTLNVALAGYIVGSLLLAAIELNLINHNSLQNIILNGAFCAIALLTAAAYARAGAGSMAGLLGALFASALAIASALLGSYDVASVALINFRVSCVASVLLVCLVVSSLAAVIAASLARAGNSTFVGSLALDFGRVVFLAIAIAHAIAFSSGSTFNLDLIRKSVLVFDIFAFAKGFPFTFDYALVILLFNIGVLAVIFSFYNILASMTRLAHILGYLYSLPFAFSGFYAFGLGNIVATAPTSTLALVISALGIVTAGVLLAATAFAFASALSTAFVRPPLQIHEPLVYGADEVAGNIMRLEANTEKLAEVYKSADGVRVHNALQLNSIDERDVCLIESTSVGALIHKETLFRLVRITCLNSIIREYDETIWNTTWSVEFDRVDKQLLDAESPVTSLFRAGNILLCAVVRSHRLVAYEYISRNEPLRAAGEQLFEQQIVHADALNTATRPLIAIAFFDDSIRLFTNRCSQTNGNNLDMQEICKVFCERVHELLFAGERLLVSDRPDDENEQRVWSCRVTEGQLFAEGRVQFDSHPSVKSWCYDFKSNHIYYVDRFTHKTMELK